MKKISTYITCLFASHTIAQVPFSVSDSINANYINARALVHGDMWWDPANGMPHCEFPKDSGTNVAFAASVWLSGYDDVGQLHVAAQTYRQAGNDYWPGPLDGGGNLDYVTSEKWAKIWKVTRSDINLHRANVSHDLTNTPASVLTWPGKGNIDAKGKDGVVLTVETDMAPFVDINGDGIYQPLTGEYPDVRGEQALWWVFSDNGPTHTQTNGNPLKVEIQVLAYAYNRGTLIDNVVYYKYDILNKSPHNYPDCRLALWNSAITGGAGAGYYIGFDSVHRMGIKYLAVSDWGGAGGSAGGPYSGYQHIVGYTFVSLPGDLGTNYIPAGSYMYYYNDTTVTGRPLLDVQYDNYMRSKWRNGFQLTKTYGGYGVPNTGYGPGLPCRYVFPGEPSDTSSWSECSANNGSGWKNTVQGSNSFSLGSGGRATVVLALLVDSVGGACVGGNFNGIKEVADTAWAVYHNPPPPILVPDVTTNETGLKIYPNPAHDELHIDCGNCPAAVWVSIYNSLGQQVGAKECGQLTDTKIDISKFPAGLYLVRYNSEGASGKAVFAKN
jgi:hypothetical protein